MVEESIMDQLRKAEKRIKKNKTIIPMEKLEEYYRLFLQYFKESDEAGPRLYGIDVEREAYQRMFYEHNIERKSPEGYEILIYTTMKSLEQNGIVQDG